MTQITLNIDDKNDLRIIRELAKRLNIEILEEKKANTTSSRADKNKISWLNKIAESGNLKKHINDPVDWQRSHRKDRSWLFSTS